MLFDILSFDSLLYRNPFMHAAHVGSCVFVAFTLFYKDPGELESSSRNAESVSRPISWWSRYTGGVRYSQQCSSRSLAVKSCQLQCCDPRARINAASVSLSQQASSFRSVLTILHVRHPCAVRRCKSKLSLRQTINRNQCHDVVLEESLHLDISSTRLCLHPDNNNEVLTL